MASRYLCHERPDLLEFETSVLEARPGAAILARSAFYPGGGGQLPDQGLLRWAGGEVEIVRLEEREGQLWHVLATPFEIHGVVQAVLDARFRRVMCELHTDLHILNALVYREYQGSLVTGVPMAADRSARIDFDLPAADNARLRALEPAINDVIQQDLEVRQVYIDVRARADPEPGGSAPAAAGRKHTRRRDRRARPPSCGGTHLRSTGESPPIRIINADSKGRHNRRIRIALAGS